MVYVEKSAEVPECLVKEQAKENGTYNCPDVVFALQRDFHNKCYLCEEGRLSGIDIEHFEAHRGDPAKKLDWANLFLACKHCNNVKAGLEPRLAPFLKCTDKSHDPENRLRYRLGAFPLESVRVDVNPDFKAPIMPDQLAQEAINTAGLLNAIYNGTGTAQKQVECANIRNKLSEEVDHLNSLLEMYFETADAVIRTQTLEQKILPQLQTSSSFAAFKRWWIRDHSELYAVFGHLL